MLGWSRKVEEPKPVHKSGMKSYDGKINKALKKSKYKCITCLKREREGVSPYCKRCRLKF